MVLSDVQPDSIGLDGRHTPKITKGGERKRWGVEREEGRGRSEAIDKAGTHRLIKIYSFTPPSSTHPPSALAWQRGGEERM